MGDMAETCRVSGSISSVEMRCSFPTLSTRTKHFAFFADDEAAQRHAVGGGERRGAERLIDVAAGVEHIFHDA